MNKRNTRLIVMSLPAGQRGRGGVSFDDVASALYDIEDVIDGQTGDPGKDYHLAERVRRVVAARDRRR